MPASALAFEFPFGFEFVFELWSGRLLFVLGGRS
jgi:hypothetical protein